MLMMMMMQKFPSDVDRGGHQRASRQRSTRPHPVNTWHVHVTLMTSLIHVVMVTTADAAATPAGQIAFLSELTACDRSVPLGMISGDIKDWQLSASSTRPTSDIPSTTGGRMTSCHERHARLYQPDGRAWCPKYRTSSEWLQVDLGVVAKITGVMTQGRGDGQEWVTAFLISYSTDAFNWKYVGDVYGNKKVFDGNTDSYSVHAIYMNEPVVARFVKFHTLSWNGHPSMRVEIIGCQPCKTFITLPTSIKMTSSSEQWTIGRSSCRAEDGLLMTGKAWCAKRNDASQWLQFDLGPPSIITGLVTTGRGDSGRHQWVTRYRVAYSNDTASWSYYSDASHLEPKEFGGNVDADLERWHFLNSPFVARYVRLYPIEWSNHVSLRAGLIGCRHTGKCPEEFTRVSSFAPCVENLSYKRPKWVNSYRPTHKSKRRYARNIGWRRVVGGRRRDVTVSVIDDVTGSSMAADSCMTLNNAYVERPTIRIDLRRRTLVSGVVVMATMTSSSTTTKSLPVEPTNATAGGQSMTSSSSSSGHSSDDVTIHPVDRLDVYVDDEILSADDLSLTSHCGSSITSSTSSRSRVTSSRVTRSQVNIACSGQGSRRHEGRYVYIEAIGLTKKTMKYRKSKQLLPSRDGDRRHQRALFSIVICDVTVY